jgi:hypothetical protein
MPHAACYWTEKAPRWLRQPVDLAIIRPFTANIAAFLEKARGENSKLQKILKSLEFFRKLYYN